MLIDTHCHIHEANYPLNVDDVIERAQQAGVEQMICVGTSEASSREALDFAASRDGVFASIGVHPHDTKDGMVVGGRWDIVDRLSQLVDDSRSLPSTNYQLPSTKLVAVGEIGLDYFYSHSPHEVQIEALQSQIELALKHDLPIIFHVRDASSAERRTSVWNDFWSILDNFHGIRGVLHSFTDTRVNAEEGMKRGLYIGVNGISTFTKDEAQKTMFSSIPLERLLLETDAPFLTPVPFRGKVNEPAFVRTIAQYHSAIRQKTVDEVADITTANARALFAL